MYDSEHDVLCAGLKLRLQSSPSEELQFDYISAPFSLSLRSVNWVRLSHCEATSPHVRLHQLREEDSLSFFMSMLSSIPATLAVVLVNHRDGYELSERLGARSEGGCPVPMVVVTRETGRELERLLRENDRAVEVKIELASKTNPSPALSRSLSGIIYTYYVFVVCIDTVRTMYVYIVKATMVAFCVLWYVEFIQSVVIVNDALCFLFLLSS